MHTDGLNIKTYIFEKLHSNCMKT